MYIMTSVQLLIYLKIKLYLTETFLIDSLKVKYHLIFCHTYTNTWYH